MPTIKEELLQKLARKVSQIRKKGASSFASEASVKTGIVQPILDILGWDVTDPVEVYPEYSSGKGKVDYALCIGRKPRVFVEVKKTSEMLSHHAYQLSLYAFNEGIRLAVLTNGFLWEFYLPLVKGKFEEKKAVCLNLEQAEKGNTLEILWSLLSREQVRVGKAVSFAKRLLKKQKQQQKIKKALPEAWQRLLRKMPGPLLVLLKNEVKRLCNIEPTEDTLRTFLSTIAGLAPEISVAEKKMEPKAKKADKHKSHKFYYPYVLRAIHELGGSASKKQVVEKVFQLVKDKLSKSDFDKIGKGKLVRWSYYVGWARLWLKDEGYIKADSPRGIWELTQKGLDKAREVISGKKDITF